MKGRNPSKADKMLWDQLCQLGCIACRKDGRLNTWVSIHHIDGRTKPGAHQKGTGAVGLIAVHPDKAEFERMYGQQEQLLGECLQLLKGESHAA